MSTAPSQGGKGMGGGPKTVTTTYSYFANLAVGLCEGRIAFIRRVWADGRELDLSTIAMRVHAGSETQSADPLIVAKEGAAVCAGLSRARLCGVRAPAARRFRQPRAAILLRGDPPRRRAQPHGARRLPHSGRERVRLRHETGDAGARSRQDETREPPSMAARERCRRPPSMRCRPCARTSSACRSW